MFAVDAVEERHLLHVKQIPRHGAEQQAVLLRVQAEREDEEAHAGQASRNRAEKMRKAPADVERWRTDSRPTAFMASPGASIVIR